MQIEDDHVQWAVVDRLGKLLNDTKDDPKYPTTNAFALFGAIVAWIRERVGVYESYEKWPEKLYPLKLNISEHPWNVENFQGIGVVLAKLHMGSKKKEFNLSDCKMWEMLVWLRNAMSHGDDRKISPCHSPKSLSGPEHVLTGFCFRMDAGNVVMSADAMRNIGRNLVEVYCSAYGGDDYFKQEAEAGLHEDGAPITPPAAAG